MIIEYEQVNFLLVEHLSSQSRGRVNFGNF